MCEKNLEGKILSSPPKSEDDILEETIVDDDIEEIVEKPKKKKRSSKKKKNQPHKYCKTCGQDILENERRDGLMFHDTYHQLRAKNYCKEHERVYSEHKCKPKWCDKCRFLINYEITIDVDKK